MKYALIAVTVLFATSADLSWAEGQQINLWERLSVALREAFLEGGNPSYLDSVLSDEGQLIEVHSGGRKTYGFQADGASLNMLLANGGAPIALQLTMQGDVDLTIPPLGGSLSNCSETNADSCKSLRLQRRSEMTLGVTACLCEPVALSANGPAGPIVLVSCYLGRGGSYLDYVFAYPDDHKMIASIMSDVEGVGAGSICSASDAFHKYRQFLENKVANPGSTLSYGVDPELQAIHVFAADSASVSLKQMMTEAGIQIIDPSTAP